jgi:hypothetical protein
MLPNFDEPYWNLLQTLGWIYLGDRALVVECSDKSEHDRTFWEKRRLPDGEVRWVEISSGPPSMMSLYVWGASVGTEHTLESAEDELFSALQDKKLTATGLRNGGGDRETIPTEFWLDAKIYDDPLMIGPNKIILSSATRWTSVKFARADVIAIWPDPMEELLKQHRSIDRPTLTIEQIAERWHGEQVRPAVNLASIAVDLVQLVEQGSIAGNSHDADESGALFRPDGEIETAAGILTKVNGIADLGSTIAEARQKVSTDVSLDIKTFARWTTTPLAINWMRSRGLGSPRFTREILGPTDDQSATSQTIAGRSACQKWLVELMRKSSIPDRAKAAYREEAQGRFEVSMRSFNSAWAMAIEETGAVDWSRPGRKSSR